MLTKNSKIITKSSQLKENLDNCKYISEVIDTYNMHETVSFHMPSHKNKKVLDINPYEYDFTEIYGFDNLNNPNSAIYNSMCRISKIYATEKSYISTNGSTLAIMASIMATVGRNGTIILGRESHKSAFSAIELLQCNYDFVYKEVSDLGFNAKYDIKEIEQKIIDNKDKNVKALFLTTPTYEGVACNLEEVYKICKKYNVTLIVDEAHGACFPLFHKLPSSAINNADIVIHSLHKTLPALTPSALLHVCSKNVNTAKIEHYLSILNTSSPSYLLMYTIDKLMDKIEKEEIDFTLFYEKITAFRKNYEKRSSGIIKLLKEEDFKQFDGLQFDITRLVFYSDYIDSSKLHDALLSKYGFNFEMYIGNYIIGITSMYDDFVAYEKLIDALIEIEKSIIPCDVDKNINFSSYKKIKPEVIYKFYDEFETKSIDYKSAEGEVSGDMICPYPPCVPLLLKGEVISKSVILQIERYINDNIEVLGVENGMIKVKCD